MKTMKIITIIKPGILLVVTYGSKGYDYTVLVAKSCTLLGAEVSEEICASIFKVRDSKLRQKVRKY